MSINFSEKEILVKRDATELIKQLKSWQSEQSYSEEKVNDWFQKGLVIPLDDIQNDSFFNIDDGDHATGIERADISSSSSSSNLRLPPTELLKVPTPPPAITRSNVESYVNIGTSS